MKLAITLCLIISLTINVVSNNGADYYMAGVVEFRPNEGRGNSTESVNEHTDAYIELIRSEKARDVDIIVFPEGTLNDDLYSSIVPKPQAEICPCTVQHTHFEKFLVRLSCAARDASKYLVVNLKERELCSEIPNDTRACRPDGWNIFNTNVVFDRRGVVISRYRKWHLYLTEANRTLEPEYAIFETDFGVRFGHIICFDILFYTPPRELVTQRGIRNIIFTSMFYSELPFLLATQLQQSWAWGNDVNLLAAGGSLPSQGSTGSGIYAGVQGALVSRMVGSEGVRELHVARVPKKRQLQVQSVPKTAYEVNHIKLLRDPELDNFKSSLLDFSSGRSDITSRLCHEGFCCDFVIQALRKIDPVAVGASGMSNYTYRFGAFNGWRRYEEAAWSRIRICGLYACANGSSASCGLLYERSSGFAIEFEQLSIRAKFPKAQQMLIMPNSLDQNFYSLNADELKWQLKSQENTEIAEVSLLANRNDLLTFGIYANYYDGDCRDECKVPTVDLAAWMLLGMALLLLAFTIIFVLILFWRRNIW